MKQVNYLELKQVIKRHYSTKLSLMIHGKIGVGKSSLVKETAEEIAKEKNKEFIEWNKTTQKEKRDLLENSKGKFIFADFRISLKDPTDLTGLPNFFDGVVEWKPNLLFKVFENKDTDGILFFDELSNAQTSTQLATYQLILDKAIGEISLNENIGIVCAGNLAEEVSSIFEMPEALRDRMMHVELDSEAKDWIEWALNNDIEHDIIGFISWKPNRLYSFDRKNKDFAFATRRKWAMCSKLIKEVDSIKEKEILISSAVGEGIALELMTFLKLKNKLDIDELLEKPEKIKQIEKVDEIYAVIGSISERYNKNPKILKQVIEICRNLEPEYSIILLKYLLSIDKAKHLKENKLKVGDAGYRKYLSQFTKDIIDAKGEDLVKHYSIYF